MMHVAHTHSQNAKTQECKQMEFGFAKRQRPSNLPHRVTSRFNIQIQLKRSKPPPMIDADNLLSRAAYCKSGRRASIQFNSQGL